jgi:hypothetical protein
LHTNGADGPRDLAPVSSSYYLWICCECVCVYFLLRACLIMCVVRGCVLLDKKKVAWGWVSFCARRKKPEASHCARCVKSPNKGGERGSELSAQGAGGWKKRCQKTTCWATETQKGHNTSAKTIFLAQCYRRATKICCRACSRKCNNDEFSFGFMSLFIEVFQEWIKSQENTYMKCY